MTKRPHLKLPVDFDWQAYLLLNPDIKKAGVDTEESAQGHWLIYGHKENRSYKLSKNINLDTDSMTMFDPKLYRWLNEDLKDLTDIQLTQHFVSHGHIEGRKFHISDILPDDFDPRLYRLYNQDLATMSNRDVIKHYINHGAKENRIYFCGISYESLLGSKVSQNIPSTDGAVLLINHDISKTGAPIFLYDLYNYIIQHNIFKNVFIVEPFPNNVISDKPDKLYHYNDVHYLHDILTSTNPTLIYSNSLNFYFANLDHFSYWHKYTILHFHEIYRHVAKYVDRLRSDISNIKTYVVSDSIKTEFLTHSPFNGVDVFPPFIAETKQESISQLFKEDIPDLLDLDSTKINIGMCGDISDRKNILLFFKLAQQNQEYNFIWIGGKDLEQAKQLLDPFNEYVIPNNFYWIPSTDNPYKYFKLLDYFFLTSKEDPCPIVVLENLLLNNKIIVIKNNIKTRHNQALLENYIEIEGDSEESIIENFNRLMLDKIPNYTTNNYHYIKNYYTNANLFDIPTDINNDSPNYIIASIYLDKHILDTKSVNLYINIINQFILRHKKYLKFVPIIVLSSDHHMIYGDKIHKYLNNAIINMKYGYIIQKPNTGYDIGGLIEGIHTIFANHNSQIDSASYIAYLHNKSNQSWKNILNQVFYSNTIAPYDSLLSKRFFVAADSSDINHPIMSSYPEIFDGLQDKEYKYIQGTSFITKALYLRPIYEKYQMIYDNFTSIEKDDTYWQDIMSDNQTFNRYYLQYQKDPLNNPIDWRSQAIVVNKQAKNYIELSMKYGLKGIPDGQFEHALERYIGYLITSQSHNLKLI